MPYSNNQGIRIHYEVEGQGPPLMLAHGLTGSIHGWHENGYVDALKGDYRLIMVDARGHGQGDNPHDPKAYELKLMIGSPEPSARASAPDYLLVRCGTRMARSLRRDHSCQEPM